MTQNPEQIAATFQMDTIADGVHRIREPWFKEHANFYLFEGGDFPLLIDAGLGASNVKQFLDQQGFKGVQVFLTHTHFDHMGGVGGFDPDVVSVTDAMRERLSLRKTMELNYLRAEDFDDAYVRDHMGLTVDQIMKQIGPLDKDWSAKCRSVSSHEVIQNGRFCFQRIFTPGHSADNVTFLEVDRGILLTGDTLYRGNPYLELVDSNPGQLIDSLRKLMALKVVMVLPGHNEILDGSKFNEVAEEWIAFASKRL